MTALKSITILPYDSFFFLNWNILNGHSTPHGFIQGSTPIVPGSVGIKDYGFEDGRCRGVTVYGWGEGMMVYAEMSQEMHYVQRAVLT